MNLKKMLILTLPPPYGGGEIRALLLRNHFIEKNDFLIIESKAKYRNKSTQGKISIQNLFFGIKSLYSILFFLLKKKPKLVYISLPKSIVPLIRTSFIILFCKIIKAKVIGELAGSCFYFLQKSKIQKLIGLFFLRKMDSIRFLSKSIQENHIKYKFKNAVYFDNGVNIPKENICVDEKILNHSKLNLIFIGALNRNKGIDILIEAAKHCKDSSLNVFFNIVGEWSDFTLKTEMEAYIEKHNLSENIKFHGLIKDESEKWKLYKSSALKILPSKNEGQPITLIEAMACGLGIISTNIGAIPETIEHMKNGIIIKSITSIEVFKAIEIYYNNREFLKTIALNNIETYKSRFTIEAYLQNCENWFNQDLDLK